LRNAKREETRKERGTARNRDKPFEQENKVRAPQTCRWPLSLSVVSRGILENAMARIWSMMFSSADGNETSVSTRATLPLALKSAAALCVYLRGLLLG